MKTYYNLIAGQSLERLAALSDGIFAVAMTLLVLNLHTPEMAKIHSEGDLLGTLPALLLSLLPYLMSFLTLGIFWVGQQTQFNQFARSDRNLTWIHLTFLLAVTLMPFSTAFLASFITYRIALLVYWFNIFILGNVLFGSIWYAKRAGLLSGETTAELFSASKRRIVIAQSLYALGALLCIFNTYVSIGFIILVQCNYAIAPRIFQLDRL